MNHKKLAYLHKAAIISLIATMLAVFAISQTPESVKLPDTPVGKTFAAFLTAFNSGQLETMRQFHREHGSKVVPADQDMNFYNQSGGMMVYRVQQSSDYEIDAL